MGHFAAKKAKWEPRIGQFGGAGRKCKLRQLAIAQIITASLFEQVIYRQKRELSCLQRAVHAL